MDSQLRAELAELRAERDQSEALFSQLERQFRDQAAEYERDRADRDRLAHSNRVLEAQLESARKDAAESQTRSDEARAAAHRLELAARSLQEARDSAIASTDLKQREVDRLTGMRGTSTVNSFARPIRPSHPSLLHNRGAACDRC